MARLLKYMLAPELVHVTNTSYINELVYSREREESPAGSLWIIRKHSSSEPSRDQLNSYTKFSVPTIANGEIFVEILTSLSIYGLLATDGGSFLYVRIRCVFTFVGGNVPANRSTKEEDFNEEKKD